MTPRCYLDTPIFTVYEIIKSWYYPQGHIQVALKEDPVAITMTVKRLGEEEDPIASCIESNDSYIARLRVAI